MKARVRNGRLLLDVPTDLPDGEVVELVPLDLVLARGGDELDGAERARLHAALRESIEQMDRGDLIDADDVLASLRAGG